MTDAPHSRDLRKHRFLSGDIAYSVTSAVLNREPVLQSSAGRAVIDSLEWLRQNRRVILFGFVVMPDHFHALLMPIGGSLLPDIMKSLKGYSAREIQRARSAQGPLWQDGYYERAVRGPKDAWAAKAYIENNPVRAGLVELPHQYPHSSACSELMKMAVAIE